MQMTASGIISDSLSVFHQQLRACVGFDFVALSRATPTHVEQPLHVGLQDVQELQTQRARLGHRLCAALYAQFAEDVVDVRLDRARADDQARRDLAVGVALGYKLQDFQFAVAQRLHESAEWVGCRGDDLSFVGERGVAKRQ